MTLFYCAHWQSYVSGTLRLGKIDVTEAQCMIMLIHIISAIFGPGIWMTKVCKCFISSFFFHCIRDNRTGWTLYRRKEMIDIRKSTVKFNDMIFFFFAGLNQWNFFLLWYWLGFIYFPQLQASKSSAICTHFCSTDKEPLLCSVILAIDVQLISIPRTQNCSLTQPTLLDWNCDHKITLLTPVLTDIYFYLHTISGQQKWIPILNAANNSICILNFARKLQYTDQNSSRPNNNVHVPHTSSLHYYFAI